MWGSFGCASSSKPGQILVWQPTHRVPFPVLTKLWLENPPTAMSSPGNQSAALALAWDELSLHFLKPPLAPAAWQRVNLAPATANREALAEQRHLEGGKSLLLEMAQAGRDGSWPGCCPTPSLSHDSSLAWKDFRGAAGESELQLNPNPSSDSKGRRQGGQSVPTRRERCRSGALPIRQVLIRVGVCPPLKGSEKIWWGQQKASSSFSKASAPSKGIITPNPGIALQLSLVAKHWSGGAVAALLSAFAESLSPDCPAERRRGPGWARGAPHEAFA